MVSSNSRSAVSGCWTAMWAGSVICFCALTAQAATVPFTEDFTTGPANWFVDSAGTMPLPHHASGGPDGGAFVSSQFALRGEGSLEVASLFRAHQALGASGGAFTGDWLSDGVTELRFFIRHDAHVSTSLTFFARMATAANFPAVVGLSSAVVPANQWTEILLPITPADITPEPPGTFAGVLSQVGNMQIGVQARSLTGSEFITFGLDKVSIIPEPATLALFLCCAVPAVLRRRTRRNA